MRESLRQSIADSPAGADAGFRYPKGSIVLCNACAVPVAILDHGIALGDKVGRMVSAFKPLSAAQLDALGRREDVDAGVRAWVRALTPEAVTTFLQGLHEFRTGDPMICPTCECCFVQVLSIEKDAVLDKSYVIELVTLPPEGHRGVAVRGKRLGASKEWIHENARVVG